MRLYDMPNKNSLDTLSANTITPAFQLSLMDHKTIFRHCWLHSKWTYSKAFNINVDYAEYKHRKCCEIVVYTMTFDIITQFPMTCNMKNFMHLSLLEQTINLHIIFLNASVCLFSSLRLSISDSERSRWLGSPYYKVYTVYTHFQLFSLV